MVLRNRRGNAYIFVVVAVLMITLLAGVALAITAASRRSSMAYTAFTGLHDLAVAGNEQALFILQYLFVPDVTSPSAIAVYANRNWQVVVADATFHGVTAVVPAADILPPYNNFRVHTTVHRVDRPTFSVAVHAYIVPTLDGNSLRMINSRRIIN